LGQKLGKKWCLYSMFSFSFVLNVTLRASSERDIVTTVVYFG
jgi:hypothetical protein